MRGPGRSGHTAGAIGSSAMGSGSTCRIRISEEVESGISARQKPSVVASTAPRRPKAEPSRPPSSAPIGAITMATKRLVAATRPSSLPGGMDWRIVTIVMLLATPNEANRKLTSISTPMVKTLWPCTTLIRGITRFATEAVIRLVRP